MLNGILTIFTGMILNLRSSSLCSLHFYDFTPGGLKQTVAVDVFLKSK